MFTPEALRHKARMCFRLSRAATGDPIADELEKLGREYERAAQLLEHSHHVGERGRSMELSLS